MHCWGELKRLRPQSKVRLVWASLGCNQKNYKQALVRMWKWNSDPLSQLGLQQVEKLVIPLSSDSRIRSTFDVSKTAVVVCILFQTVHQYFTRSDHFCLFPAWRHYVGMWFWPVNIMKVGQTGGLMSHGTGTLLTMDPTGILWVRILFLEVN